MKSYPKELKDSVIARMIPPNNVSVPDLVRETGIPKDTLYTWRSKARRGSALRQSSVHKGLSSEEKQISLCKRGQQFQVTAIARR